MPVDLFFSSLTWTRVEYESNCQNDADDYCDPADVRLDRERYDAPSTVGRVYHVSFQIAL